MGLEEANQARVARAMNKAGNVAAQTMAPRAIFQMFRDYGQKIGVSIGPHDLRRSLGTWQTKNAALKQIQLSLGHASFVTTERYLGVRLNLHDAPCDYLGCR